MSVNIQPLADYVVAEPEDAVTKTAGGFYLPEKAAEKPTVAKVVAIGKNVSQVKVGDKIVTKEYSPTKVKVGDVDYIIAKEEDILAVVK